MYNNSGIQATTALGYGQEVAPPQETVNQKIDSLEKALYETSGLVDSVRHKVLPPVPMPGGNTPAVEMSICLLDRLDRLTNLALDTHRALVRINERL
jgi:hypothetical protein